MLVLSRKVGERIQIGDSIVVTVVRIGQNGARIGIEAPPDMTVIREELARGGAGQLTASSGNLALETAPAAKTAALTTATVKTARRAKSSLPRKRKPVLPR